ncbi:CASP-like protein 4A2 [Durio zibethinus]|uniref:CASP-like protein n=1 Tax=Durio zibethinus TaxID=66656 RepID=A0A6P5YAS1_DURZI|nr:CASP-like protein 4A2 [Durio zibethinus]
METKAPVKHNQNLNGIMKRSSSSNSNSLTHQDSPHSPLRFHSPLRSDQGDPDPHEPDNTSPPYASPAASPGQLYFDNSKALVVVDKPAQFNANASPFLSPPPPPTTPPQQWSHLTVNRAVREEGQRVTTRTKVSGDGGGGAMAVAAEQRRSKVQEKVKMAALGFRLSEIVLCLISFSVMAADKTQGWSGDSYNRYKEYRYCLSVNVIGFVYAGFQAYDLAYYLITEKRVIHHYLRQPFDFFMDQILAYLLISASSAAATRVDDWQSNWGKDEFTEMASASVAMAFLAFIAFAFSSLISGYELCTHESS